MIDGVRLKQLKVIPDGRGFLMEMIRKGDGYLEQFGQVYMTVGYPGVVKGWHYHKGQDDNFCIVKGMAQVALCDHREDSPTNGEINEFFIGEHNPCLIHIPRLVLHGFMAIGTESAYLVNTVTAEYDYQSPDEHRVLYNDRSIPYEWHRDLNS